ncbi:MAG: RNA polymerase sigma factor [Rhodospirillales bacterium]|nr:RNA polymerase sigma factor [Rhodospirillales bacterium]
MDPWPPIIQLLPDLRTYARSLADNAADAEDLVSDAIERTVRSGQAPQDQAKLRPWMFRTIRNLAFDALRKHRVRRESLARLQNEAPRETYGLDDAIALRRAYESLPAPRRQVLSLVDALGLTYAEAAKVMEVPKGTVMSRLSRARRALLTLVEGGPEAVGGGKQGPH